VPVLIVARNNLLVTGSSNISIDLGKFTGHFEITDCRVTRDISGEEFWNLFPCII
jgi:hypothetical protein